jgi:hypothetical protein
MQLIFILIKKVTHQDRVYLTLPSSQKKRYKGKKKKICYFALATRGIYQDFLGLAPSY